MFGCTKNRRMTRVEIAFVFINSKALSLHETIAQNAKESKANKIGKATRRRSLKKNTRIGYSAVVVEFEVLLSDEYATLADTVVELFEDTATSSE